MKTDKLFNVLVLGWMLVTSPMAMADTEVEPKSEAEIKLEELLNEEPIPAAPAFCSKGNENTCVEDEEGNSVPRAGIACCWSTSCDS